MQPRQTQETHDFEPTAVAVVPDLPIVANTMYPSLCSHSSSKYLDSIFSRDDHDHDHDHDDDGEELPPPPEDEESEEESAYTDPFWLHNGQLMASANDVEPVPPSDSCSVSPSGSPPPPVPDEVEEDEIRDEEHEDGDVAGPPEEASEEEEEGNFIYY